MPDDITDPSAYWPETGNKKIINDNVGNKAYEKGEKPLLLFSFD